MPDVNPVAPVLARSVDRLALSTMSVRDAAAPGQWGNPTCPTCLCATDE